jgi:hypothetical protein
MNGADGYSCSRWSDELSRGVGIRGARVLKKQKPRTRSRLVVSKLLSLYGLQAEGTSLSCWLRLTGPLVDLLL